MPHAVFTCVLIPNLMTAVQASGIIPVPKDVLLLLQVTPSGCCCCGGGSMSSVGGSVVKLTRQSLLVHTALLTHVSINGTNGELKFILTKSNWLQR